GTIALAIARSTGNVGIGTDQPTDKLHVANGSIRWGDSLLTTNQGGSIELAAHSKLQITCDRKYLCGELPLRLRCPLERADQQPPLWPESPAATATSK